MTRWLAAISVLLAFTVGPADAHEMRPGYLEVRETAAGRYHVVWKQPARGDLRLVIDPVFPVSCRPEGPRLRQSAPGAFVDRLTIVCDDPLPGATLAVAGLEATLTDVLVRIQFADGRTVSEVLKPNRPSFRVPGAGAAVGVLTYVSLGVEHILLGADHLLFVLGLVFLVDGRWLLFKTISAFTVGHSVSLALATLGAVRVPAAPLEAAIALSIVFLAAEIVRARRGERHLTTRRPWIVASAFGLLHGLGFASALTALGLPASAIPTALLLFNVGVEVGQILFVVVSLTLIEAWRRLPIRRPSWIAPVPMYAMGIAATLWFVERLSTLVNGGITR